MKRWDRYTGYKHSRASTGLATLPPSVLTSGELEAYLELKHSLTTLLSESEQLEAHVGHLLKLLQGHPGGVN